MNEPITVYVPCDRVRVNVQYTYGASLSPMEKIAVRAIGLGGMGVDELVNLLQLGQRLTLDLLHDLWRQNYILMDFVRGRVELGESVKHHLRDNALDKLGSAERNNEHVDLAVDKLIGHVHPGGGRTQADNPRLKVPVDGGPESFDGRQADIIRALEQIEQRRRERERIDHGPTQLRPRRIVAAHLDSIALREAPVESYVPLRIRVGEDPDSERLLIEVIEPTLPEENRRIAARELQRLARERPSAPFIQTLRSKAATEYVDPPPLEELVDGLVQRVARLSTTPAGKRVETHRELLRQARSAEAQFRARLAAEVDAEEVTGPTEHQRLVIELIENATKQIVLVCPTLRYESLSPLVGPLHKAVEERDVRVVIVWGKRHGDTLEKRVLTTIAQLETRFGKDSNRLLWSQRPSRVNARLVICDDRKALVTGYAFADLHHSAQDELGVLLKAQGNARCQPIETLLEWTRRRLPYFRAKKLSVYHSSFSDAVEPAEPAEDDLPDTGTDRQGDGITDSAMAAWCQRWNDYVSQLRRRIEVRTRPYAEVIEDGAHRDLLWRELRGHGRLGISAYRLSSEVIEDRLVKLLQGRLAAGNPVKVTYCQAGGTEDPDDPAGRLRALRGDGLDERHLEGTNVRVLLSEKAAVIGSYDFLGSIQRDGARHWITSEVGIRLVDPGFADRLADRLGMPPRVSAAAPVPAADTRTRISASTHRLLNELSDHLDEGPAAAAWRIRSALEHAPDVWQALAELSSAQTPDGVLRVAAATALTRESSGTPEAQRWLNWLMLDRWKHGDFAAAALLRARLDDPTIRPRRPITVLAVSRATGLASEALEQAIDDDLKPYEWGVLAAATGTELLCSRCVPGDARLQDLSQLGAFLLDVVTETGWRDLLSIAQEHWQETQSPLPVDLIAAKMESTRLIREAEAAWTELDDLLRRHRQTSPPFGEKTHNKLYGSDGAFGQLVNATESRDGSRVRRWTAEHPADDLEAVLDRASAEVTGDGKRMTGLHRRHYLSKLEGITKAANKVVRLVAKLPSGSGAEEASLAQARGTIERLGQSWTKVMEARDRVEQPERHLVATALTELEGVIRWERS